MGLRGCDERERETESSKQARVVDERAGREEQNDGGARAADTGETRVKDEDMGVARASLARILISSTAHISLSPNLVRSRTSSPGSLNVACPGHGMAHLRTYPRRRLRQIGKPYSLTLLRATSFRSHSSLLARLSRKSGRVNRRKCDVTKSSAEEKYAKYIFLRKEKAENV